LTDLTDCAKIQNEVINNLSKLFKRPNKRPLLDTKDAILVKQGREQFKKLIEKGIELPVVLL
jgi:hypothetical protein